MKKKLYSFIVMLCLFAISCFSGCTLVSKDVKAEREEPVIVVGEKSLTTNDIINSFYSFYQQNQYYFYYSDKEAVMDSFYNSIISREVVLQEAQKMFKEDKLILTESDYADVWNDVFDYFHDQIDTYEKNLLAYNGIDEDSDKYPARFKDSEDKEEEKIKYEEYEFESVTNYVADPSQKGTLPTVAQKIDKLTTFIKTKYVKDVEAETREEIDIANEELVVRAEAFEKYIAQLMLSAKIEGKAYDRNTVFVNEIQRVLDAYVESALYEEYKEYVNTLIISDTYGKLNKEAVVNRYTELLGKDREKYETYSNYTKVLSSSDNESLILYHNGNETTYFTVQHILVKFDDATLAELKEDPGYSTGVDIELREYYENNVRNAAANTLKTKEYLEARNAGTGLEIPTSNNGYSAEEIVALYNNLYNNLPADKKTAEAKAQIFNKLAWEFSEDTGSLKNELSNVLGFAISSENYEHGSLVKDFTNGARALYNNGAGNVGDVEYVVSDYGIHIMALTGVYETGAVAEVVYKTVDGKEIVDVDATYNNMSAAKVSNMTNQSIYEYIYDQLKEELIGEKGTFFTEFMNNKTAEYREAGKIDDAKEDRPTYDELMDAMR